MQKSILHFAVLLNDIQLIKDLLTKGATALINQPDYITQFTPLHFALFVENPDLMELLLRYSVYNRLSLKTNLQ